MKIKSLFFVGIFSLSFLACTSDSEDDLTNPPVVTPDPITYAADIQSIMDNACNQCHSDPTQNGAPISLTTYTQVRFAVENRNLIDRMNSDVAPMPPQGLLPQATRDIIQQWIDDGFLEE